MRGYPVHLSNNNPDEFYTARNFDIKKFFNCYGVCKFAVHTCQIVETVGIRHNGRVINIFTTLLKTPMQVTEIRYSFGNNLTIGKTLKFENAMGRGVLRAHGEYHLLGSKVLFKHNDVVAFSSNPY